MKVAYYGEPAPKSLRPLVIVILMAWAVVALGFVIVSGVI